MKVKQQHLGLLLVVVGAVLILNNQGLLTMEGGQFVNVTVVAGLGTTVPSGETPYTVGSPITLTANPGVGYVFDKWQYVNEYHQIINTWTDNPVTITFGNGYYFKICCYFKTPNAPASTQYDLAIFLGSGGTTNPSNGHYLYDVGAVVSVRALPASSYVFDHWVYDDVTTRTENPISVTMNANHGLVPYFLPSASPLAASVSPSTATVNVGISKIFYASASGGVAPYYFEWYVNGICTYHFGDYYVVNTLNPGTVTVKVECTDTVSTRLWSSEAVLTVQNPTPTNSSLYVLTVGKSGSGTVTPTEGTHSYPVDSVVTLNAIADSGSSFVCWTIDGANVTSSSSTVTMSVDHAATAFFTLTSDYVPPVPDDNQTLPNDQNQLPSGNEQTQPPSSPELLGELGLVLIGAVVFFASVKRKRGAG